MGCADGRFHGAKLVRGPESLQGYPSTRSGVASRSELSAHRKSGAQRGRVTREARQRW